MKHTIEVPVPYKGPGNAIIQKNVLFDLYRENEIWSLVPRLSENERRIANLPEALRFYLRGDRAEPERGSREGNLHVIEDALARLREKGQMPGSVQT